MISFPDSHLSRIIWTLTFVGVIVNCSFLLDFMHIRVVNNYIVMFLQDHNVYYSLHCLQSQI